MAGYAADVMGADILQNAAADIPRYMAGSHRHPSELRRSMSRLPLCALALVLIACASKPAAPPSTALVDRRPPLIRIADSTSLLVSRAALVNDTANVHARVALRESTPERTRARVENAQAAANNATRLVDAAIVQGDYLNETLPRTSGSPTQSASFTRYWLMGREKLTIARARSASAATAAAQALECTATECAMTRTQELQGYVEQAAGASREAESLVRLAMVYVDLAMGYVR